MHLSWLIKLCIDWILCLKNFCSRLLDLFSVAIFVHLVSMVKKYLGDLCCKNEVFGLDKIVENFDDKFLHHLMENN